MSPPPAQSVMRARSSGSEWAAIVACRISGNCVSRTTRDRRRGRRNADRARLRGVWPSARRGSRKAEEGFHGVGLGVAEVVSAPHVHEEGRPPFRGFEMAPRGREGLSRQAKARRLLRGQEVALLEVAAGRSPEAAAPLDDLFRVRGFDYRGDEARAHQGEADQGIRMLGGLYQQEAVAVDIAAQSVREAQRLGHLGAEYPFAGFPHPLDECGLVELIAQPASGREVKDHCLPRYRRSLWTNSAARRCSVPGPGQLQYSVSVEIYAELRGPRVGPLCRFHRPA